VPSGVYHADKAGDLKPLSPENLQGPASFPANFQGPEKPKDLLNSIDNAKISGVRKSIIKDAVVGFGDPSFKSGYAKNQSGRGTVSRFFNALAHPIKFVRGKLAGKTSAGDILTGFGAAADKTYESTEAGAQAAAGRVKAGKDKVAEAGAILQAELFAMQAKRDQDLQDRRDQEKAQRERAQGGNAPAPTRKDIGITGLNKTVNGKKSASPVNNAKLAQTLNGKKPLVNNTPEGKNQTKGKGIGN
jgi:hypothetical protein